MMTRTPEIDALERELDRMWALADEFRARARRLRIDSREARGTPAQRMSAAAEVCQTVADLLARAVAADNRLRAGRLA